MYINNDGEGIIRADKLFVGQEGNEKVRIFISNDEGVIRADKLFVGQEGDERIRLYEDENGGNIKATSIDTTSSKTINAKAFTGEFTTLETLLLVVNGYGFSPRTITVDGQQITVLAR